MGVARHFPGGLKICSPVLHTDPVWGFLLIQSSYQSTWVRVTGLPKEELEIQEGMAWLKVTNSQHGSQS